MASYNYMMSADEVAQELNCSKSHQYLLLTGKLNEHLNQIDQESRKQMEMLMGQMVERQGVTEQILVEEYLTQSRIGCLKIGKKKEK